MRLVFVVLAACWTAPVSPPVPSPSAEIPGLAELVRPGAFLVFGEIHGTDQLPGFVGLAARRFAAAKLPVAIGMEIPGDEQERIDRYLRSDGGDAARVDLVAGPFWTREFQDGRSSRAAVDLIETARTSLVRVIAYDQRADADPAVPRDEHMAKSLLSARDAEPGLAIVVLTGNIHARRIAGLPPAPDLAPMASFVAAAIPELVTLDCLGAGGSFWACFGNDPSDCGVKEARAPEDVGPTRVDLTAAREGYDGVYVVGSLTASLPTNSP